MKTKLLPAAALLASALLCAQTAAQTTYSTVAIEGSTNPAIPVPNLNLTLLNAINAKGQAVVLGVSATPVDGLWVGAPGAAQLLALDDAPAPGVEAGALFLIFDNFNVSVLTTDYSFSSAGQVVLRAPLRGSATTANNVGLWAGAPGAVQLVARKGSPAPDTEAGTVFSDISPGTSVGLPGPTINASGQVAFAGSLSGPAVTAANGGGLWMGPPGSLKLVQRGNMNAFSVNPLLNDAGQVAFSGSAGITTGTPGATQLLVRFGVPAPSLSGATNQGVSGQLAFNNAGQVAFTSILTGSVSPTNNRALWLASGSSLQLLARTGTQAPGVNAGIVFSDFTATLTLAAGTIPVLNGAGQVAFIAKLAGPSVTTTNDFGIWLATSSSVQLVAREGDLAPGLPDGVRFLSIATQPALNDKGQLAFFATLVGPGVTSTNNTAIIEGKLGALQVVARTGAQIDAGNGVTGYLTFLRTLYSGLGSSQGGHSPGIGEDGQVLFSGSLFNQATFGTRNAVLMATPGSGTGGGSAPRILSVLKTGNDVAIRFTTEAGKHYALEFKDDLSVASWSVLPGDLTAAGTEGTIADSTTGKGATRFYRVKVL